jgi:hypothetical protein
MEVNFLNYYFTLFEKKGIFPPQGDIRIVDLASKRISSNRFYFYIQNFERAESLVVQDLLREN